MSSSKRTTIGQDAQDLISAEIGETARNITIGKDNAHATADVNVTLGQVAAMSERELNQIGMLASKLDALGDDVAALVRELTGNPQYGSPGVVQRLNSVEARQMFNRLMLALFAISEILQWVAIIYWLATRGNG